MAGGVAGTAVQSTATLVVCREANQFAVQLRADGVRGPGMDLGGGCRSMQKKGGRMEGGHKAGGLLGNYSWISTYPGRKYLSDK